MAEHEEFIHNALPQLFVGFVGDGHPPAKFGPRWNRPPKFWKAMEDPEFMAKKQEVAARIGKIIEREKAKRAAKK
jgi:hypothetical protein